MDPERWRQVREVLAKAVGQGSEAKSAYLADLKARDPELYREVEHFLTFDRADSFLEHPAIPPAPLSPGSLLGPYEIQTELGAGGMGAVYKAFDTKLQRPVAIKILNSGSEDAQGPLIREARAASAMDHPNICTIYEVGEHAGQSYIAMALVEGETLQARIQRGALSIESVVPYGIQIAEALAHAHTRGIIHRDLKSANVVVTPEGRIKVLDFGLAARLPREDAESVTRAVDTLSDAGALAGTLAYMAPEVLCGEGSTAASDVWALGVLLYEMASNALPFKGKTGFEVTGAILHATPAPLPATLPAAGQSIIRRCLTKEPQQRYQGASEVHAALQALELGLPVVGGTDSQPSRVRRWLVASGAAAAAMTLVFAATNTGLRDRFTGARETTTIASVVALPASVRSTPDDAYLADAIPNTISTYLAQVEDLETLLPPTSIEVNRVGSDIGRIAAAYGASALVLSSVTTDADQLLLNVQLVESGTRQLIWGQEYEGPREDYLDLIQAAADDIRRTVRPTVPPVVLEPTDAASSAAELEFQRGVFYSREYNNLRDMPAFELASEAFQRALDLDPTHADAAAEIGFLFRIRFEAGLPPGEAAAEMVTWANRALEIDPRSARPYLLLAIADTMAPNARPRRQLLYVLEALTRDPNDALAHRTLASSLASCRLGLAAGREARRLDPLYLFGPVYEAFMLYCLGLPSEALDAVDQALDVEPNLAAALVIRGVALIELGRAEEAAAVIDTLGVAASEGRVSEDPVLTLRMMLAFERGQPEEAEVLLARLLELANATPNQGIYDLLTMDSTPILVANGRIDAVLQIFGQGVEAGFIPPYDWLTLSPHLEALRGTEGFAAVATASLRQFEQVLDTVTDARSRGELPTYLEEPLSALLLELGL